MKTVMKVAMVVAVWAVAWNVNSAVLNEYRFDHAATTLNSPIPATIYNQITSGPYLANPYMFRTGVYTNLQVAGGPFSESTGMMQTGTPSDPLKYMAQDVGAAAHPAGLTSLTMEMWVNPVLHGVQMQAIDYDGSVIALTPVAGGYKLLSQVYTSAGYRQSGYAATPTLITAGSWWHIAMTYDGTTVKEYVNGILEASQTFGTALAIGNAGYGGLFIAGISGTDTSQNFYGNLDEIRISDVALLPGNGSGLGVLAWDQSLAATPEPSSIVLLGLGAGITYYSRRRKAPAV